LPAQAQFEVQPLSFVFASAGPLLLVDGTTGQQTQLGSGEGALVPAGTNLQRTSLAANAVNYLAIELVEETAAPPADGTVLETGEPFAAPKGLHDFDLLADTLAPGESLAIPDSGAENLLLVTSGAATATPANGESEVLLAGESATFVGEYLVSPAPDTGAPVSILAAMIGPEIAAPPLPAQAATPPAVVSTSEMPVASPAAGQGSITVQVYACPSGMTPQRIDITACAPITSGFDVTISGPGLAQPLTLSDAASTSEGFTWHQLAFGDYEIVETQLPAGVNSSVLAARGASGNRIRLDAAQPDLSARIYNFSP
jgi:hypothetical protein